MNAPVTTDAIEQDESKGSSSRFFDKHEPDKPQPSDTAAAAIGYPNEKEDVLSYNEPVLEQSEIGEDNHGGDDDGAAAAAAADFVLGSNIPAIVTYDGNKSEKGSWHKVAFRSATEEMSRVVDGLLHEQRDDRQKIKQLESALYRCELEKVNLQKKYYNLELKSRAYKSFVRNAQRIGLEIPKDLIEDESSNAASIEVNACNSKLDGNTWDCHEKDKRLKLAEEQAWGDRSSVFDEAWHSRFLQMKSFINEHGHSKVPNVYKDQGLLNWTKTQRKIFREYRLGKKCKAPEKTRARLDLLDHIGFVFSLKEESWETMFDQLRNFHRVHGHTNIPKMYRANQKLANWVGTQRRSYRDAVEFKNDLVLKSDRIKKLNELGFIWHVGKGNNPLRKRKRTELSEHVHLNSSTATDTLVEDHTNANFTLFSSSSHGCIALDESETNQSNKITMVNNDDSNKEKATTEDNDSLAVPTGDEKSC